MEMDGFHYTIHFPKMKLCRDIQSLNTVLLK